MRRFVRVAGAARVAAVVAVVAAALATGCSGGGAGRGLNIAQPESGTGTGTGTGGGGGGGGVQPGRTAEPFVTIDQGQFTRHPGAGSTQLAIRDDAAWQAFWAQHRGAGQVAPPVDFTKDLVIAALFIGRPTGGYGVEVAAIDRIGPRDDLEATVVETVPDPRTPVIFVITSPFHIVRVARNAGALRFVLRRELGIETLAEGEISGLRYGDPTFAAGEVALVADDPSYKTLWADHTSNVVPPPAAPAVDFATSFVVAAFQGYRVSNGYTIRVTDVYAEEPSRDLLVDVEVDERGGVLTVLTNPFSFVRATPRVGLPPAAVRVRRGNVIDATDLDRRLISGFRFTTPSYAGDRLAFTDAAAFQAFWAQHTATQPARRSRRSTSRTRPSSPGSAA